MRIAACAARVSVRIFPGRPFAREIVLDWGRAGGLCCQRAL